MAIVLDCGTHVTCLQHDYTITGCSGLVIEGLVNLPSPTGVTAVDVTKWGVLKLLFNLDSN